jgi:predicted NAD/FAD-binding protein
MNDVYLHRDEALMPRNKKCWASWNCLEDAAAAAVRFKDPIENL